MIWFALPVLSFVATALGLAFAWPRRRFERPVCRTLWCVNAAGLLPLIPWIAALTLPIESKSSRIDLVVWGVAACAIAAVCAVGWFAASLPRPAAWRARVWWLAQAIWLVTVLTPIGKMGIGQIL